MASHCCRLAVAMMLLYLLQLSSAQVSLDDGDQDDATGTGDPDDGTDEAVDDGSSSFLPSVQDSGPLYQPYPYQYQNEVYNDPGYYVQQQPYWGDQATIVEYVPYLYNGYRRRGGRFHSHPGRYYNYRYRGLGNRDQMGHGPFYRTSGRRRSDNTLSAYRSRPSRVVHQGHPALSSRNRFRSFSNNRSRQRLPARSRQGSHRRRH